MALIKCKECGKEISKDAEVCPHCGKKVSELNILCKSIIYILALFSFPLLCYFSGVDEKTASSYSANKIRAASIQTKNIVYQKISPQELEKKLEENAARAQQQYKNKYIEFEGKLGVIDANGEYFSIATNNILSYLHCDITNKKQKNVLISKNAGDIVHVKGKITSVGELAGYRIDVIELK